MAPRLVSLMAYEAPVSSAAFLPESSPAVFLTADQSGRVAFWGALGDTQLLHEAAHSDAVELGGSEFDSNPVRGFVLW